jgi:transcriptional regulator of acetoin/glycerol metabolism
MTSNTIELHQYLVSNLGEEKIDEICNLFGNERISFVKIKNILETEKIKKEVKNKGCVKEIAALCGVHRSTIYRKLKRNAKA